MDRPRSAAGQRGPTQDPVEVTRPSRPLPKTGVLPQQRKPIVNSIGGLPRQISGSTLPHLADPAGGYPALRSREIQGNVSMV